ncbi:MAG: response regulator transcription factor [Campylobacterales bacterium]|nr:response regulator transcription factor [Campylobacterales bacterium]
MKILLLEDDYILGETLREMISNAGYEVLWVKDGQSAADAAYDERFDLYVFDINVSQINGFDLLESLRNADDMTPTIFISALTDIAAITKGFACGADDYLKKPFYPEELLVRIGAKLAKNFHNISHGKVTYNPKNREVSIDGKVVSLGDVQLPFLELFINNIGRTIDKEYFLEVMESPSDTGLRVAINKLKNTTGWDVQNVRGIGYRLEKS